ncbi:MAG: 50S ribosomal protein L29 [Chloroflexi bacterium]|nr:50S ribosomal protein L29 [Chloroflexota bacterium]
MKAREIHDLSTGELRAKIDSAHQELFNLRFQLAQRQLTNHARLTQVRRDIARLKTLIRERELSEAGAL